MCGIAGMMLIDGGPVVPGKLRAMANQMAHRGPDDAGYWVDRFVGLAHRRLSIIDVHGSRQPMARGQATISFNGEIFNYMEIRRELQAGGYNFQTRGDTEVLLALYLQDGFASIKRLDGQFAFAIYDKADEKLLLFRDRMGVLPLFYYWDGRTFLFASEIKALLRVLPKAAELDVQSLKEYLAYRSVPFPDTLFRGIKKLPPGHKLCLDRKGRLQIESYWSIPTERLDRKINSTIATNHVQSGIEQAVSSRMVGDVPVGAYLSGGVDSSLLVAMMKQVTGGAKIETYSAGFNDVRFDELPYARRVSKLLGTRHHEVIIEAKDFENLWSKLTWHRDAPVSEPADLAIFRLALKAQGNVKVLLSGEGSDELFAGYPKYRFAKWAALSSALPPPARYRLFHTLERCLPERASRLRIMVRAMSARCKADRFQSWFAPFTAYERDMLIYGTERRRHEEIISSVQGDTIRRMLYFDCHSWLVDNLLERGDRMSMAASIECRPPFLDHRLVELAFSLPSRLKVRAGSGKWIFKQVAYRYLPSEIVERKKVGFRVPLDAWFREDLRNLAGDMLLSRNSFVGGMLDRGAIGTILDDHFKNRRNEEMKIWTLLCLEVWYRVFFQNFGEQRVADERCC